MRPDTSSSPSSCFFEERIVRSVVPSVDVVERHILRGRVGLYVLQRDQFGTGGFGLRLFLIPCAHGGGGWSARERSCLERGAALRACDRTSVQIVELRAAGHAAALQTEFRFGHSGTAFVRGRASALVAGCSPVKCRRRWVAPPLYDHGGRPLNRVGSRPDLSRALEAARDVHNAPCTPAEATSARCHLAHPSPIRTKHTPWCRSPSLQRRTGRT